MARESLKNILMYLLTKYIKSVLWGESTLHVPLRPCDMRF